MDSNKSKKVDHETLAEIHDLVNDDIELTHEEKDSKKYNSGFLRRPQKFDKVSKLMDLLREDQINWKISSNFCGLKRKTLGNYNWKWQEIKFSFYRFSNFFNQQEKHKNIFYINFWFK